LPAFPQGALGPIHGGIGHPDELRATSPIFSEQCAADASPDHDAPLTELMRMVKVLADLSLHPIQPFGTLYLRQQDDEFIASVSARRVTHTNTGQKAGRHAFQNGIAGVVSELVIHRLEVIQVDQEHAYFLVLPCRLRHCLLEPIQHEGPVRQSGEWIVIGESTRKRHLALEPLDLPAKSRRTSTEGAGLAWFGITVLLSAHARRLSGRDPVSVRWRT